MKKLLLALVVIAAMLTLSACSDSTGVTYPTDDELSAVLAVHGVISEISPSFPWPVVEGATVSLYKWGTENPVHQDTSDEDGEYYFNCYCYEGAGFYKVTASTPSKSGSSGWFYWSYQNYLHVVNIGIE